jgi:hypothetical protein
VKRVWDLAQVLVEQVELFAWLEAYRFAGGNGDFGAGPGIAADAGFARFDCKDAKATEFNAIARDKSRLHAFKYGIDSRLCFGSRKACSLYYPLYKILLDHLGRHPWAVIWKNFGADRV